MHFTGKRGVLALCGVANPIAPSPKDLGGETVPGAVDFLDQPTVMKCVEEAEAEPLSVSGAFNHIAQAKDLAMRPERPQDLRGVNDRLNEVGTAHLAGWLSFRGA
jgi:hypothetical protein